MGLNDGDELHKFRNEPSSNSHVDRVKSQVVPFRTSISEVAQRKGNTVPVHRLSLKVKQPADPLCRYTNLGIGSEKVLQLGAFYSANHRGNC
jgi:hypothetical protein